MELLLGRKAAAELLDLSPVQNILDVATGTGALAYQLATLGHSVLGIDTSPTAIIQAKKKYSETPNIRFEQADATHLPFDDGAFDGTSSSFALHDMPQETAERVLKEMKRVTKPHGRILIVDYNEPQKHWGARLMYPLLKVSESAHFPHFVGYGLENLLATADLQISKATTCLGMIQIALINRQ